MSKRFDKIRFGKKLRECRQKTGKSQETVVKEAGISRTTLSSYENGTAKHIPQYNTIKSLSDYYGEELLEHSNLLASNNEKIKIADVCKYTGLSEDAIERLNFYTVLSNEFGPFTEDTKDGLYYPYLSALISNFSLDTFSFELISLESFLCDYFQSSKEIRELELALPEKKKLFNDYLKKYEEYNAKTNGLVSNYMKYYVKYLSIQVEDNYENLIEIDKLDQKLCELTDKIHKVFPELDIIDLCENSMEPIEYNRSIDRINKLKSRKARALSDIIEYLEDSTKNKSYRMVRDDNLFAYKAQEIRQKKIRQKKKDVE